MKHEVTPATNWPLKSRIILLDAWMKNPIGVKVIKHPNADHLVAEDERGIVYYARTDRVVGFDPYFSGLTNIYDDFADILG
ncbi:hypothetical protein [Rhizobium phage RHph_X2_30]|nr:hypothetical protein [Rhizobium phage RHph_X2_30]